jgi:hypothetical protein
LTIIDTQISTDTATTTPPAATLIIECAVTGCIDVTKGLPYNFDTGNYPTNLQQCAATSANDPNCSSFGINGETYCYLFSQSIDSYYHAGFESACTYNFFYDKRCQV